MAIIKCKMCGGDLALVEGSSIATCEFCGTTQTVPNQDNEKKLTLFARANRLRASCEFDKAAGIYESIVADFPEEAEAYWGLVLCKYGIEYVDDPGTSKKIPTCHRSSFDSVMEDANFEQAMENADMAAQKVYRDEAKQFERIRKGILEVSSTEKPYDIFICYKETAPNGDRTLDSVLAQDLYSALTDKGYRVFFSRITLQGKLGEAFEPYIFAALNSAKVMLAVGTSYEYYNAVWVKNEWSRYLKICEADKSKHLIPCYKDLDPEDMPKEFNHLQGADLGKMGAIQDILFNMEKYIPLKKQNTTVIQERVVVGGSGNNKIASLLDRGNMALEDGDWAKADSFFEDVLNNDSKNAQAYLGKTLAMEKCRTIDAFARKRKDATQNVRGEKLELQPNHAHVDEMVKQFSLPGYVEQSEIRKLYNYDLSYHSDAPERRQQYHSEENYWANHKWLSKAERFAVDSVAEHLQREKDSLLAALSDRVKKAESAETAAKQKVQERYETHLRQADEKAERLYNEGISCREKYYQELLKIAKTSSDIKELTETAKKFEKLGDYQDSKNLAVHCQKRASEEQATLDAEAERQRLLEEKRQKEETKKTKICIAVLLVVAVAAIAINFLFSNVIIPAKQYNEAIAFMEAGNYEGARTIFESLGNYKESPSNFNTCNAEISKQHYNCAIAFKDAGDIANAAIAFGKAGNYLDAREQSFALWDQIAIRETLVAGGSYTVGLRNDGTVVTVGSNEHRQCDVSEWTDIIAISAGGRHTVGLQADGTLVAVGSNDEGQCNISEWTDIVAISTGFGITVGLKSDGTVLVAGSTTLGIIDVSRFTDIISISASGHIVGLKTDGTVVATGADHCGQCNVSGWTDITSIYATGGATLGIKSDGTVIITEYPSNFDYGENDVHAWKNIVSVCSSGMHTVGLTSDGTVSAVGLTTYGRCDVSEWTDIVAISEGGNYTLGLKADGTVIAVGYNKDKQCNVDSWENIKIPD